MYNCSQCGYSTDDRDDFANHVNNCSPLWRGEGIRRAVETVADMTGFDEIDDVAYSCTQPERWGVGEAMRA